MPGRADSERAARRAASGANARTAAGDARRRSRRASRASAPRRCSTIVPSGSTNATPQVACPRGRPRRSRCTPTRQVVAALLAHDAIGGVEQRLRRVEQRVGRLEHVVTHLGHRAEQLADHALQHRRRRERPLLGPGRRRSRPRPDAASVRVARLRRSARRSDRSGPARSLRDRSRRPLMLRLHHALQVPQRGPHDHARRPPLDQPRHRHRQVDAQGVVDQRAVAVRRRTRTGRRARAACHPRPAPTRTRAARRRSRSRGRSARCRPSAAAWYSTRGAATVGVAHEHASPASRRSPTRGTRRTRRATRSTRSGGASTWICSCASSAIDRPRSDHVRRRGPAAGAVGTRRSAPPTPRRARSATSARGPRTAPTPRCRP